MSQHSVGSSRGSGGGHDDDDDDDDDDDIRASQSREKKSEKRKINAKRLLSCFVVWFGGVPFIPPLCVLDRCYS